MFEVSDQGTLLVRDVSLWLPELQRYMDGKFKHPICNMYVSPKGATCERHREGYDVWVVQLKGSKLWHFDDEDVVTNEGDELFIQQFRHHWTEALSDSVHLTIRRRVAF